MTAAFPNKTGSGLAEDTTASIICSQKDFICLAVCAFSFHLCHQSMMLWNRTYLLQACIYSAAGASFVHDSRQTVFLLLSFAKSHGVLWLFNVLCLCCPMFTKITPLPHEYGELHISHLTCLYQHLINLKNCLLNTIHFGSCMAAQRKQQQTHLARFKAMPHLKVYEQSQLSSCVYWESLVLLHGCPASRNCSVLEGFPGIC